MKKIMRTLFGLLCSVLMFACNGRLPADLALEKLSKGVSTEADVRAALGEPEAVWQGEKGARTLEYPQGPEGGRTWMVDIDADGTLRDYTQVLSEQNFATVMPGMSRDEVRRKLGRPRSAVRFDLKNEEVWDWLYLDGPSSELLFNAHFDIGSGKLVRTSVSDPVPG